MSAESGFGWIKRHEIVYHISSASGTVAHWHPKKTYHKDVSQSQLWFPVPLESIYTYCTRRLLDVWVPDARLERRLWWASGIVFRDSKVQSPQPVSIGRTMRPSDKHGELA